MASLTALVMLSKSAVIPGGRQHHWVIGHHQGGLVEAEVPAGVNRHRRVGGSSMGREEEPPEREVRIYSVTDPVVTV